MMRKRLSDNILAAIVGIIGAVSLGVVRWTFKIAGKVTALGVQVEMMQKAIDKSEASRGDIRKDIAGLRSEVSTGFQEIAKGQTSFVNVVNGMTNDVDSRLSRIEGRLDK